MIITVDNNSDIVTIDDGSPNVVTIKTKDTKVLVYELINSIVGALLKKDSNIYLDLIDEDSRRTLDEWSTVFDRKEI